MNSLELAVKKGSYLSDEQQEEIAKLQKMSADISSPEKKCSKCGRLGNSQHNCRLSCDTPEEIKSESSAKAVKGYQKLLDE